MATAVPQDDAASFATTYTTYSNLNEPGTGPNIGEIPTIVPKTGSAICPLSSFQTYSYGVGHFFNDLAAACWFNYLLLYLTLVNPISDNASVTASWVMLAGQIADGVATPFIGAAMDKVPAFCGMGKKRPFYLFGTIMVSVCLANIFTPCTLCTAFNDNTNSFVLINYIIWPVFFNIGWAMVQVAHMSMPPSLSNSRKIRDKLNNLRNAFTFFAYLYCFTVALLLFQFVADPPTQYQLLSYISTGSGLLLCFGFIIGVQERRLSNKCDDLRVQMNAFNKNFNRANHTDREELKMIENVRADYVEDETHNDEEGPKFSTIDWFKRIDFYQYGIVYMCVRIGTNVTASMLQFYMVLVLKLAENVSIHTPIDLAVVPMLLYLASSITSLGLTRLSFMIGRKLVYTIGMFMFGGCCVAMMLLPSEYKNAIFIISPILGVAQSMTFNIGLNFIGEVVGGQTENGSFVFGAYGLLDKLSNGLILFFMLRTQWFIDQNELAIRIFTIGVPTFAIVVAGVLILLGKAGDFKTARSLSADYRKSQEQKEGFQPQVDERGPEYTDTTGVGYTDTTGAGSTDPEAAERQQAKEV